MITVHRYNTVPITECAHPGEMRDEQYTAPEGLRREEQRHIPAGSDVPGWNARRFSDDNGRTWSEWEEPDEPARYQIGDDEMFIWEYGHRIWNPVHKHYYLPRVHRLGKGSAVDANHAVWAGTGGFLHHAFIEITFPDGRVKNQLIRYEDGPEYAKGSVEFEYSKQNLCRAETSALMECGDILLSLTISMKTLCQWTGRDIEEMDPTKRFDGIVIARGKWNPEKEEYDLTFSRPAMLSTVFNSRGVNEPAIAELKNGRIVVVFRGSNLMYKPWNTRIEPHMPGFKWYMFSDDGGKTFTDPMPWHFDCREVIYSGSTLSKFYRSSKTGKLYWIGNISGPEAYANWPRHPLHICEIHEEWGVPLKETLTVIDTRREGEGERIQLSNFDILEDRETGNLEVTLTKTGDLASDNSGVWKYIIELD